MVTIRNQLVPASVARTRTSPGTNPCLYITVHETANRSRGANAQAHANLQSKGNARAASWHIQVDDREAIRSYLDTVRCWHGGDGGGHGNMSSIGLEICVNSDGDYEKALANAADVIRQLRTKHNIPRERVVQHNHWSGKNCPTILRSRGSAAWRTFVASTDPFGVGGVTVPPASTPDVNAPTVPEEGTDTMRHYIFTHGPHQYWLNPRDWTIRPIEGRHDVGASHRAEIKTLVEATGDTLHNWRDRPNAGSKSDELGAVGNFTYVGPESTRPKGA